MKHQWPANPEHHSGSEMLPAQLAAMRGMAGRRLRQAAVPAETVCLQQKAASRPVSSSSSTDEDILPSGPTGAAVTAAAQQERCISSLHAAAGSSPLQSRDATVALWQTGPQQQGHFQVPRLNLQPRNADTSSQGPAWVGCTQFPPGQLRQQPDAGPASSWAPAGRSQALDDVGTAIAWSGGGAAATAGDVRKQLADTSAAMQLAIKRGDHTAALDRYQPHLVSLCGVLHLSDVLTYGPWPAAPILPCGFLLCLHTCAAWCTSAYAGFQRAPTQCDNAAFAALAKDSVST